MSRTSKYTSRSKFAKSQINRRLSDKNISSIKDNNIEIYSSIFNNSTPPPDSNNTRDVETCYLPHELEYLPDGWDYCQPPQDPTYLMLVGNFLVDNEIINQPNCYATQEYATIDLWHRSGYSANENQLSQTNTCHDDCDMDCRNMDYPRQLKGISDSDDGVCNCFCVPANETLRCYSGYPGSGYWSGSQIFPNITQWREWHHHGNDENPPHRHTHPTGKGEVIGIFYNGKGTETCIGFGYHSNMYMAGAYGSILDNDYYTSFSYPGIVVHLTARNDAYTATRYYPDVGETLNSDNTKIRLYRPNTDTIHQLEGYIVDIIFGGTDEFTNGPITLTPAGIKIVSGFRDIGNTPFENWWNIEYDEYGNAMWINSFGFQILNYTFSDPIHPIRHVDVGGNRDCWGNQIEVNVIWNGDSATLCVPIDETSFTLTGGAYQGTLPEEICQLDNLQHLNLAGNQFTGNIPSCYGDFQNLQTLNLSNNNLDGILPSNLQNTSSVAQNLYLKLDNNNFYGDFPEWFCGMPFNYLNISDNNFSGVLPCCVCSDESNMIWSINNGGVMDNTTCLHPQDPNCEVQTAPVWLWNNNFCPEYPTCMTHYQTGWNPGGMGNTQNCNGNFFDWCDDWIYGCNDSSACNYDPEAHHDDGSCWYATPPCTCEDGQYAIDYDGDGICDVEDECIGDEIECCDGSIICSMPPGAEECPICGCMSEDACNYNEDATIDDGSCEFESCDECESLVLCCVSGVAVDIDYSERSAGCGYYCNECPTPEAGSGFVYEELFEWDLGDFHCPDLAPPNICCPDFDQDGYCDNEDPNTWLVLCQPCDTTPSGNFIDAYPDWAMPPPPPGPSWMDIILMRYASQCDSEKACFRDQQCPREFPRCTYRDSLIGVNSIPGCCVSDALPYDNMN